ncbi:MAG: shikimate kinase [Acidimicrobiales bacterium]
MASPDRLVIAAAASTVEDPLCRAALGRNALTIVLDAPLDEILERASTGDHRRPIDRAELEELVDRRVPLFNEIADMMVSATKTRADMVDEIVTFIAPEE